MIDRLLPDWIIQSISEEMPETYFERNVTSVLLAATIKQGRMKEKISIVLPSREERWQEFAPE